MSSITDTPGFDGIRLSVLDLVHVRAGQSTSDAVAVSTSLAQAADRAGFERYWVAEHHNMPASAATNPPLLIAILAAATERIRVGSGAVLLPNHAPLALAEQFALLEAAFPGRIDLGLGRASGTDSLTRQLLGAGTDSIGTVAALMDVQGARFAVGGRDHEVRASPMAESVPPIWVLGASEDSARAAAARGLSYVFGHHLGVPGSAVAVAAYRASFRPSPDLPRPRTLLPVRASVADDHEQACRAALPWLLVMLGLQTGRPQAVMPTIEQAERLRSDLSPRDLQMMQGLADGIVIGDAAQAWERLRALAVDHDVDEIMIHPIAGAHEGDDPRTSVGQTRTLRLLAEEGGAR